MVVFEAFVLHYNYTNLAKTYYLHGALDLIIHQNQALSKKTPYRKIDKGYIFIKNKSTQ